VNSAHPRQFLLACALVCAVLAGCGGAGRLAADAPSGVDISGTWRLNRALSDDPEKMYEKWRLQRLARSQDAPAPAPPPQRGQRRPGDGQNPDTPATNADGSPTDPNNPLSPEAQALLNNSSGHHLNPYDMGVFGTIPRGDLVTIKQRADEIYIFDGSTDRSFTPGAKSVVSVPEGVADPHSGWKSRQYVIDVRAQAGPETIEHYYLSADGKQLLADIESSGGNLPRLKIKRVYDRASTNPNVAPTND
jgi:hypothetical protein